MRLKTRLFMSFLLIVILPILLAFVLYFLIASGRVNENEETSPLYFTNTIDTLINDTDPEVQELKQWSKAFPDRFLKTDILKEINLSLIHI